MRSSRFCGCIKSGAMLSQTPGNRAIVLKQKDTTSHNTSRMRRASGSRGHRRRAAAAGTGVVLLAIIFILFSTGSGVLAQNAGIDITTSQLVYAPADKAVFNIALDSGGQSLSGDLILRVYPAASPADSEAFARPPLSESMVQAGLSVSGTAAVGYEASISDLKAGTGGFPVKVSLVQNGAEVLSGFSWLAVVDGGAHVPIDLVLVWTVGGPPQRDPQGVFTDSRLLERCQQEPRTPDSLMQHAELAGRYPRIKTTYAIEGALVDELFDMSDGFPAATGGGVRTLTGDSGEAAIAGNCLESLRQLAAAENTELVSSPYVFASLPALAREGWDDGNGQYRISHDIVTGTLSLPGVPNGAYVPGLDLTTDSLRYVASTGGDYAVLAGSIRPFVVGPVKPGSATFRLRDLGGERITSLFAQDDASAALLGDNPDAGAFFAALANSYNSAEPARLVIAASPTANPSLSAEQRDRVYSELDRQGWINSLTLGQASGKYRPDTEPVTLQRYIEPISGYVAESYYQKLSSVHDLFEAYRRAVDTDEPELLAVVKNMYTAESGYFLASNVPPEQANQGLAYQDAVDGFVREELSKLTMDVQTPWMQKASGGDAEVVIVNNNPYPFNLELTVSGEDIDFPEGASQLLRLPTGRTQIKVPYEAKGWTSLSARLNSHGVSLAQDSAGVRLVTTRVWIVLIVAGAAVLGASAYFLFVVRRRRGEGPKA